MTAPAPTIPSARAALLVSLAPVVGWRAAGVSAAVAVAGLATVAFAAVIAHLVDAVVFHGAGVADLALPLSLLAGIAVARAGATRASDHFGFEAAARVRRRLLARLLDRLSDLGPVRLADRDPGTLVATLTEAVDGVAPLWRAWQPAATRAVVVPLAVLDELRSAEVAGRLKLDVDRLELVFLRLVVPLGVTLIVGGGVITAVVLRAGAAPAVAVAGLLGLGGLALPFLAARSAAVAGRREAATATAIRRGDGAGGDGRRRAPPRRPQSADLLPRPGSRRSARRPVIRGAPGSPPATGRHPGSTSGRSVRCRRTRWR